MLYQFKPEDVCATQIEVDVQEDKIKEIRFVGGCGGNLEGISRLVKGMSPKIAANLLAGVKCKGKGTSCPDQLAKALSTIA